MKLLIPVRKMLEAVVTATGAAVLAKLQSSDSEIRQLHFRCAPPDEVVETLLEMNATQDGQMQKYPLFAFFEDIKISTGKLKAYYGRCSVNGIIATQTDALLKSDERETATFIPILRVIYEEFFRQLSLSPYFANQRSTWPHDYADRKRWGREGLYGRDGNLFADRIDAIEIMNLELTIRPQYLQVPTSNLS